MRISPNKVIITCAITGNLTKPNQTQYLPITAAEIAASALGAADAGASIVHIHVRDPVTGPAPRWRSPNIVRLLSASALAIGSDPKPYHWPRRAIPAVRSRPEKSLRPERRCCHPNRA